MYVVRANRMNSERKLLDNIVHEINGICHGVLAVDLQGPDPGSVINCCVLKTTNEFTRGFLKLQKFNINLNMMSWDLLLIAMDR